jgi:hypothetical protein
MQNSNNTKSFLGDVMVVIVWLLDLQLPVQSVLIATKVASLNPAHDWVYSKQHYVIMFVSDLRQFSLGTSVSSTNKTDCHDVTEILLKVALNTINLNQTKHFLSTSLPIILNKPKIWCVPVYSELGISKKNVYACRFRILNKLNILYNIPV